MNTTLYTNNDQEFASKIAGLLFDKYIECIKIHGSFNLGLTGGNTPKLIYNHLKSSYIDKFDWAKVNFFFVDERCVPMDAPESNFKLAHQMLFTFFSTVNVYRFKTELPEKVALEKYRSYLSRKKIHCALLGMGEDGHVGSIFPNSDEEYSTESVIITNKEYNGFKRFSFSIDSINQIESKILMINKNQNKERIINSGSDAYPINRVKNLTIVVKKS